MRLRLHRSQSRRVLTISVTVGLVTLGGLPTATHATTPTCADVTSAWPGTGPVEIGSANDLYCMGEGASLDRDFLVTGNIDLADLTVDTDWRPIASSQFPFTGSFDGGGKTITGLSINQPNDMELGLFGFIRDASISNVTLAAPVVNGGDFVGSLVGEAIDSTITGVTATSVNVTANLEEATVGGLIGSMTSTDVESVTVTGSVDAQDDQTIADDEGVGGVIGRIWDGSIAGRPRDTTEVSNATFAGSVSGPSLVGGVIGHADTDPAVGTKNLRLTNLASAGTVSSTLDFTAALYPWAIGGVIGMVFDADLSNIRSTSSITSGIPYTGGLVGRLVDSTLGDAHASGDVTIEVAPDGDPAAAECSAGGLVGATLGDTSQVTVTEASATGDVSCLNGAYTGGLIGWADNATITKAIATGNVAGSANVAVTDLATSYLGGLIGWVGSGSGSSTVRDVVSTGTVTGWRSTDAGNAPSPAYYGGLLGDLGADDSLERAYTTSTLITDVDPAVDATIGSMIGHSAGTLTGLSFTSTDPDTLQIAGTLAAGSSENAVYRSLSDLGKLSTYSTWNSTSTVIVDEWVPVSSRTTQVWGTCATVASGLPFLQWQRTEACPGAPAPPSPSPSPGGGSTGGSGTGGTSPQPSPATDSSGASASVPVASGESSGTPSTFQQPAEPQRVTATVTLVPASVAAVIPTRTMRREPAATLSAAPVIAAAANQPVKLLVPGLTPGAAYTVQVRGKNGYVVLGSVTADADGQALMPVFRMSAGAGTTTLAIVSASGTPSYVKVQASNGSAADRKKKSRGTAGTPRR